MAARPPRARRPAAAAAQRPAARTRRSARPDPPGRAWAGCGGLEGTRRRPRRLAAERQSSRRTTHQTQRAGAQARLIQFEGVLDSAKHEFVYIFDDFPQNLDSLRLTKSVFEKLPKSIDDAEKIVIKNNPSLIAARISTDISKEAINTARASLFPKIKGIVSHSEKQDFGGIVGFKRESSAKIDFSYPLNLSLVYAGKDAAVQSYLSTQTRIKDQEDMITQM